MLALMSLLFVCPGESFRSCNRRLCALLCRCSHRRPARAYSPPSDLQARLWDVFTSVLGPSAAADTVLGDLATKHRLLTACADRLGHHVTNSQLHCVRTLGERRHVHARPFNPRMSQACIVHMRSVKAL